jgi:hypothetical protein
MGFSLFCYCFLVVRILGSNILLSTLFSNIFSPYSYPNMRDLSFTPTKNNGQNYVSLHLNML